MGGWVNEESFSDYTVLYALRLGQFLLKGSYYISHSSEFACHV